MVWVLLMFFDPATAWRAAAEAGRNLWRLCLLHLLPLLLIGCVAEGWAMLRWGKRLGRFDTVHHYNLDDVLRYQGLRFVIGLALVLGVAALLRRLANNFHSRNGFREAFTVAVFGLGPLFLLRIADAHPALHPLLTWLVGAALAAAVLYQGIPLVLHTDPAHAIGLYFFSALLIVLASLLAQVGGVLCLPGAAALLPFLGS